MMAHCGRCCGSFSQMSWLICEDVLMVGKMCWQIAMKLPGGSLLRDVLAHGSEDVVTHL